MASVFLAATGFRAAVAFGDSSFVDESLNRLAPLMAEVEFVEVRVANGVMAKWSTPDHTRSQAGRVIEASVPVYGLDETQVIGTIRVELSSTRLEEDIAAVWRWAALALLFGTGAAVGLGIFVGKRLGRPIERLSAGVDRIITSRDLSQRIEATEADDEVAVLSKNFNRMMAELERAAETRARAEAALREGLEREMNIARRIQTALLPSNLRVPGYRIAARMVPAAEVGGDYYDVLSYGDTAWFAIGDVSSHGVTPGLIMMMAQSIVSATTAANPNARPSEVFAMLNRTLHDNIQERLRGDHHMTLVLLRSDGPGRFLFSGAHLDILVRRANGGDVIAIPTVGPWAGLIADVTDRLEEGAVEIEEGDVMLLYTDGITEARSRDGAMFDVENLQRVVRECAPDPEEICSRVLREASAHMQIQEDDMTLLAIQRIA